MKLESIELQNVGPFRTPINVGPFDDGLNILAARNEAGKSTVLMAAARTLFDRHTVTGDAIEGLRPVGTALAPEITVTFAVPDGRFRIHKRFLNSSISELSEYRSGQWKAIADGDAADDKVLELIGGVRSGRGASQAKHWGLLRYLWARQEEPSEWPQWDDSAGAAIRSSLARVEIDTLLEDLSARFQILEKEQFTDTGKVKKNSQLQILDSRVQQIESDLSEVGEAMSRLDDDQQKLRQLSEELSVRGKEKDEAKAEAGELTEQLRQLELLQKDLERFENTHETTRTQLAEIDKDQKTLSEAKSQLEAARKELQRIGKEQTGIGEKEQKSNEQLEVLKTQSKEKQQLLEEVRRQEDRFRELKELHDDEKSLADLERILGRAGKQEKIIDDLNRKRTAIPDVSKRVLNRLEEQEQKLRDLTVRAEAVGLRVSITLKRDGKLSIIKDGSKKQIQLTKGNPKTVVAARDLRLSVPQWGDIDVASGAEEVAEIERDINGVRSSLEAKMKDLNVASVKQAQIAHQQAGEFDREIKSAKKRLADLLDEWDSMNELKEAAEAREADISQRRALLAPTKAESKLTASELKAELADSRTRIASHENELATISESFEDVRCEMEALNVSRQEADRSASDIRGEISGLESKDEIIQKRYSDGIENAKTAAQTDFVEAEARLKTARGKLPKDWEKLAARHDRALKAAEQAVLDHEKLKNDISGLEAVLDQAGSQGLYSRESTLLEQLDGMRAEAVVLRRNATAARLLAALLDCRKKEAVKTVLEPLEDQLSATFSEITGDRSRRVFLDENLQITGIGPKRDESYVFSRLSQGAREQLLLALRAAVAIELSKNGPQILILDDVLANTDSVRQQNVLDFLQNIAQNVQVLVVTCHAERYRGVGVPTNLVEK